MVNRIADRIESARKIIKFRRIQLEQTAKYIKKVSKQNRENLTKKFSSHVDTLQAFFNDYKKR